MMRPVTCTNLFLQDQCKSGTPLVEFADELS